MKQSSLLAAALLSLASFAACAAAPPVLNAPTAQDSVEINALLANYTDSVSTGDRARFESQLLDVNIPFAAVPLKAGAKAVDLQSIQDYAGFRRAIFDGGQRFRQRFSNVKIEQLGNLAQVSLDYETALQGTAYAGKGWKVIELIKVNGQWKIASEFFTGYPAR
jgi:hypothetical protein